MYWTPIWCITKYTWPASCEFFFRPRINFFQSLCYFFLHRLSFMCRNYRHLYRIGFVIFYGSFVLIIQ